MTRQEIIPPGKISVCMGIFPRANRASVCATPRPLRRQNSWRGSSPELQAFHSPLVHRTWDCQDTPDPSQCIAMSGVQNRHHVVHLLVTTQRYTNIHNVEFGGHRALTARGYSPKQIVHSPESTTYHIQCVTFLGSRFCSLARSFRKKAYHNEWANNATCPSRGSHDYA